MDPVINTKKMFDSHLRFQQTSPVAEPGPHVVVITTQRFLANLNSLAVLVVSLLILALRSRR